MSATATKLGIGADGPWENRRELIQARHPNPNAVDGWLNATYSVQLFQHRGHEGVDHLCVRRHDDGTGIPWTDMQRIKDRLADDGTERWGLEVFPPVRAIVDNYNLRHIWVMPPGWVSPVDLRQVQV